MTLIRQWNFQGLDLEIHAQSTDPAPHPHLALKVFTPDRLLLGGGAVVEDTAGEGTLLTAVWPFSNTEWDAKGKDHEIASPGRLRVFCIAASVRPDAHTIVEATTPAPTAHPTAEAVLPPEYLLVGGGARANWEPTGGPGSLLFASRPGSGQSWFAAAKDHRLPGPATVTAYAIGVSRRFLSSLGLTVVRFRGTSVDLAERPRVTCGIGGAATLIAGGAETHWSGAGSLLTGSAPQQTAAGDWVWAAEGKQHIDADPSTASAWGVALVSIR